MSTKDIYRCVDELVGYGLAKGLLKKEDEIYTRNKILMTCHLEHYEEKSEGLRVEDTSENVMDADLCGIDSQTQPRPLAQILDDFLAYACEVGLADSESVVSRDLFDTKLMDCLLGRPSEVIGKFREAYAQSPKAATAFYYEYAKATNYIREDRVAKDKKWISTTEYGDLDITINLSKPEKDPKAIAAARKSASVSYPKCQLCMENEGYAGRMDHPARENHRIIPVTIQGNPWGFQYSPYVYYNEHCIVFNSKHVPMQINHDTFCKLFDFVKAFPHYFVGSNADLPIVGGSILSHDHFQGGHYEFAMAKAPVEYEFVIRDFEDVQAGIVKWPMSVIRLAGNDPKRLIALADRILAAWRGYTDEAAFIYAETEGELHNTITPIARCVNGVYQLDLVLRNNITTKEHPLGVYHPHADLHHIKKENIGLIEVMGLAVLPARLKDEMEQLKEAIIAGVDLSTAPEAVSKHAKWAQSFATALKGAEPDTVEMVLQKEIGLVFSRVLEDAGVYKRNEAGRKAFLRFIESI